MKKIKLGIVGYGNIGRGVEKAIAQNVDTELIAVFTRRTPSELKIESQSAKVLAMDDILNYKDSIDVLILCGGSATDLPKQGPMLAEHFNIVDSFETHAKIPEYFDSINAESAKGNKISVISVGWDPGLFSMVRMISNAILPVGKDYTFWGKGVSQGHSDAIRRVEGVKNGIQFTIPIDSAIDSVRNGENPVLSTREKHT
jgi:diaminopimelate dehydrogenase